MQKPSVRNFLPRLPGPVSSQKRSTIKLPVSFLHGGSFYVHSWFSAVSSRWVCIYTGTKVGWKRIQVSGNKAFEHQCFVHYQACKELQPSCVKKVKMASRHTCRRMWNRWFELLSRYQTCSSLKRPDLFSRHSWARPIRIALPQPPAQSTCKTNGRARKRLC